MTTKDAIFRFGREYLDYHGITQQRGNQSKALLADLAKLCPDGDLTKAGGSEVQQLAGEWLASGYHPNTVRKKLNQIRPFFGWAYSVRAITADQLLSVREVKNPRGSSGKTLPKPYTRTEVIRFWAELDAALPFLPAKGPKSQAYRRWQAGIGPWRNVWKHAMRIQVEAMVRLALDLGLRRSEIFNLSVNDLHYDNEYLVIKGKADPNTGHVKVRTVPFTYEARMAVMRWLEFRALMKCDHDAAWVSCWGSETYRNPMHFTRFKTLLHAVVGEDWTWHRFRHTCATNWLRAGAELETVSRLLGHATLQQTLGYAEILKTDLAKKLGKVESAFGELVAA